MQDRLLTIPNLVSSIRAIGIPVFLYVYLGLDQKVLGFLILVIGGITDYLDGKLARALNQESKLGAILDPAIDRAYIAATLIALTIQNILPVWLAVLLIFRDVFLGIVLFALRRIGAGVFEVTYLGKAATFCLLYALPFLLLSERDGLGLICSILGWAFAIWGLGLYLLTGFEYSYLGFKLLRKAK